MHRNIVVALLSLVLFEAVPSFGQISNEKRVSDIICQYENAAYTTKLRLLQKLADMGQLATPALTFLIQEAQSPHELIREKALVALETLGPHAAGAIDVLILNLQHPSLVIAAQAAQCLGAIGVQARRAQDVLRQRAHSFGAHMLESVLLALGDIHADFDKTQPLLITSYGSKIPEIRRAAVITTGKLDRHGAQSIIYLEHLHKDPDKWVRAASYDTLAKFPEEIVHIIPMLIFGLKDSDYYVRTRAAKAFGTLGPIAHQGALPLAAALHDPSHRVVLEAAKSLYILGSAGSIARQKIVNASKTAKGEVKKILLETIKKM